MVSGESGAGKTETVKIVLQHLARLPDLRPQCDGFVETEQTLSTRLMEKIMVALPIFEAFGNAQTRKNQNSSRFGKMSRLHYTVDAENHVCRLQGFKSDVYLLETSRVVSHVSEERNFHIFYEVLAATPEDKHKLLGEEWKESAYTDFKYLNTSTVKDRADRTSWRSTASALKFFGFDNVKMGHLAQALGTILRLGNVSFKDSDGGEAKVEAQTDLESLARSAEVSLVSLTKVLVAKSLSTSQEEISVTLSAEQAQGACDALARVIYAMLFNEIVETVNGHTSVIGCEADYNAISIMDIFGFERYDTNYFEQLCVNYTSEKLQQKYVQDNLIRISTEYAEEGVEYLDHKAIDNSPTVCLFEGKSGLIRTLDDEGIRPNGNSEVSFVLVFLTWYESATLIRIYSHLFSK